MGDPTCDCICGHGVVDSVCPTPDEQGSWEAWGINCDEIWAADLESNQSESAVDWSLITLLFSSLFLVAIAVLAVILLYRHSRRRTRGKFVGEAV